MRLVLGLESVTLATGRQTDAKTHTDSTDWIKCTTIKADAFDRGTD